MTVSRGARRARGGTAHTLSVCRTYLSLHLHQDLHVARTCELRCALFAGAHQHTACVVSDVTQENVPLLTLRRALALVSAYQPRAAGRRASGAMRALFLLSFAAGLLAPSHAHPRFAVCISGQLRTLRDTEQLQNVKTMLVDALPGGADVFAVFPSPASEEAAAAAARLGAVSTQFIERLLDIPDDCPWKPSPGAGAFYMQAFKVAACFEAVHLREKQLGFTYEYVVRTRPDIGLYAPISSWLHLDPEAVFVGYNHKYESCGNQQDFFAVVPAKFTATYRSLPDLVSACSLPMTQFQCNIACNLQPTDFGPEARAACRVCSRRPL